MSSSEPPRLQAWSLGSLGTLAKLTLSAEGTAVAAPSAVQVCVLLDASGSMGRFVSDVVSRHLPAALDDVIPDSTAVHLVTFNCSACVFCGTANWYRSQAQAFKAEGMTYMAPGVDLLASVIAKVQSTTPVVIVVISDGALRDRAETNASVLAA
jgi:Mg-chelatase subunit ChlD